VDHIQFIPVLKNERYATNEASHSAYKLEGERGPNTQATAEIFDPKTDTIFYTQINRDAISCWNVNESCTPSNHGLVDSDPVTLVYPNDMKVDRDGNMWVLSDRLPLFWYTSLKAGEVNYRVLTEKTSELIQGTPCESA
jgi:hypothetical protein